MSNIGFRIIENIKRPSKDLISSLKKYSVSNVADCINRFFCMHPSVKMVNDVQGLKLCGCAITVKTRPTDNLMVHKALEIAKPGDVIVINAFGDMNSAILGEIMVRIALKHELAGFVVDGCIRDLEGIRDLNFPVFSKGVNPKGPYKDGPGEINYPISCGGVIVNPGDIVLGDRDGIVIIPPKNASSILKEVEMKAREEEIQIKKIENGERLDRGWIDEKLINQGCKFVKN